MINNLDEKLPSTWRAYTNYLKECILKRNYGEAIEFVEKVKHPELAFTLSSNDYVLYWALLYAYNKDFSKTLEILKKAYDYGYKDFWKFDANSHHWDYKENYLQLEPLHKNDALQNYVKSVHNDDINRRRFELFATPLCWFEKIELKRKNIKCIISNNKLQKGEQVYAFRQIHGSSAIPKEFLYAQIEAFESSTEAKESLYKYTSNSYKLSDYACHIYYKHPLLNFFWHNIEDFDLLKTLKLIANPPVNPTPYIKYTFNEKPLPIYDKNNKEYSFDRTINYGTGGEFLNLLYVLVKCGYLQDILKLLPQLPEYFPYLFLFFNSKNVYYKIGIYLQENINELSNLFEIAFKNYNKKSIDEVFQLASYGRKHTRFLKQLSICLNIYECHLFSYYRPGINCFFQEFYQFEQAKGGGLLDFFITAPELIPSLHQMKSEECYLIGFSNGVVDTYDNSLVFLYRTIVLNTAFEKNKALIKWIELPEYIRNSTKHARFKRFHKHTLKNVKTITNISNSRKSL